MSEALLCIYKRSEGFYLVVSAQTTAGVWQHCAESPALLDASAEAEEIGDVALRCLQTARPKTPHPRRDEWTEVRRASLTPIMRCAKVRSWKAFTGTARLVEVHRSDLDFTVTPMPLLPDAREGYEPDIDREWRLNAPTARSLGAAVVEAFSH